MGLRFLALGAFVRWTNDAGFYRSGHVYRTGVNSEGVEVAYLDQVVGKAGPIGEPLAIVQVTRLEMIPASESRYR